MELNATLKTKWHQGDDHVWRTTIEEGWMQGRSVFGGVVAATLIGLGRHHIHGARQLRTMSAQFLRPTVPGEAVGHFEIQREGKYTTFAQAWIEQGGERTFQANLIYSAHRDSALSIHPEAPTFQKQVDQLENMPYIEGLTPQFTQNVHFRWSTTNYPFLGSDQNRIEGYFKFDVPTGDAEGIAALLDTWPCPSLGMLDKPSFASSVQWTAHFIQSPSPETQWYQFSYETLYGKDSFHTVSGHLYDEQGNLLGWTEQLVAVYD